MAFFIEILSLIVVLTSHYRGKVGWVFFPRWGEDGGAVENVILVWLVAGRKTKLLVLLQFHITSVLLIILSTSLSLCPIKGYLEFVKRHT